MKRINSMIVLSLFLACTIAFSGTAADSKDIVATITYLLSYVEQSDCTFIRNNRAHTAQEAADHMQKKYDHFKDEIKTPEDFIRLSASKSIISDKPYMICTKSDRLAKSETWLLEVLEAYRQERRRETTGMLQQSVEQ